jgi:hypothetical protein
VEQNDRIPTSCLSVVQADPVDVDVVVGYARNVGNGYAYAGSQAPGVGLEPTTYWLTERSPGSISLSRAPSWCGEVT